VSNANEVEESRTAWRASGAAERADASQAGTGFAGPKRGRELVYIGAIWRPPRSSWSLRYGCWFFISAELSRGVFHGNREITLGLAGADDG
jgi:hypothetical protein